MGLLNVMDMEKNMEEASKAFLGLLKAIGVPKNEAVAIVIALEETDSMDLAFECLEKLDFKVTPEEAMTICIQVIEMK